MANIKTKNLDLIDKDNLFHPITNLKAHASEDILIIDRGEGVYVYDTNGKKYLEGLAGLWCSSLGYGVEELGEAAKEQMNKLGYSSLFASKSHEPAIRLSEKLIELSPYKNGKVFFGNSGSDANDTQLKLYTYMNNALGKHNKKKILSRIKGYHGVTVASACMTGLPAQHKLFDLPTNSFSHAMTPHFYREGLDRETENAFVERLTDNLEALIEREDPNEIAAMIAEPLMGAGGVILPPEGYFPSIQKVLNKYDIPLIDDEVVCAFGRTGNMWGAETFQMNPSSITIAKALSAGFLPISAVIVPDEIYNPIKEASGDIGIFGHGYTYSGHPVSCAVALKTIEIYERENIFEHVNEISSYFQSRAKKLEDLDFVGEVRGVGLICGIEMVSNKSTKAFFEPVGSAGKIIAKICQDNGLIVRAIGDVIALCPPLVITRNEVDELFDILEKSIKESFEYL
jgi:4-aminobutyrate--pyruvate transaminase